MDQITIVFPPHPLVCIAISLAALATGIYFSRRADAIKFAKWVADKGQYQPIEAHILEEAIQEADDENKKSEFLNYLKAIRIAVGHKNVKIGHLYWIWDQMNKNILAEDQTEIPTFSEQWSKE